MLAALGASVIAGIVLAVVVIVVVDIMDNYL
jgi:hypothetical protein